MRARSWMAALALIVATSIIIGRGTFERVEPGPGTGSKYKPRQSQEADAPKPSDACLPLVKLNLFITDLGQKGCEVEVKPANAGCKFKSPSPRHITAEGKTSFELKDVEIRRPDHNFTLAITVREPGQAAKTVYRNFRMADRPPSTPGTQPPPRLPRSPATSAPGWPA